MNNKLVEDEIKNDIEEDEEEVVIFQIIINLY